MRISALLLLLMFWAVPVMAQPGLMAESLTHDFGEVLQGESVEHRFRFQNTGDQPLELSNLRSSCGCTAALLSARRLEPGGMGELQVTFDSRGFQGRVQKHVTVDTNDPAHPVLTFSLSGVVRAELYVDPQRVNWGRVAEDAQLQMKLQVNNDSQRTVTLQKPSVTNGRVHAELSTLTLAPGEKSTLLVTARPSPESRRLAGYIILQTDLPGMPRIRIPVSARFTD